MLITLDAKTNYFLLKQYVMLLMKTNGKEFVFLISHTHRHLMKHARVWENEIEVIIMEFSAKRFIGHFTQTEHKALMHTINLKLYLDASIPSKRKFALDATDLCRSKRYCLVVKALICCILVGKIKLLRQYWHFDHICWLCYQRIQWVKLCIWGSWIN